MRLFGLSLAVVLLLSSIAFAQHHDTPAPPPPPPPPPPAAAPSPAASPAPTFTPSPTPSFTPSAPSAPPVSHVSPPSAPSPAPAAPIHTSEPSSPPAPAHISEPSPAAHAPEPGRIVPEQKITGEQKIESAPRVGEELRAREPVDQNSPDKEKEAKAEPDLRRHLCGDKPCEKPEPMPVEPTQQDLRHRPCVKEPCACPAGQTASKGGGCLTTVVQNDTLQCPAGQVRVGGVCVQRTCPPNRVWNGIMCVPAGDECFLGSMVNLIDQLTAQKARKEDTCTRDPGSECLDLTREHAVLLEQYRAAFNQASMACRNRLPDPDTL